jgi:DNA-binding IclR family transcriptional regulator
MANRFPDLVARQWVGREPGVAVESRGVQSVEVGGRLLDVLVAAAAPMMLRDLAARANIPAAQAHVYLTSFKKLGFVEQDRSSGHYRIGPFAMRLAMAKLHSDALLQRAADAASDLSTDLGVTVTLTVWGSGAPTVLLVRDGPEELTVNLRPGRVYAVTTTATGRLFAAFRAEDDVQTRISYEVDSGSRTPEEKKRLRAELKAAVAAARTHGYTIADGAPVPGHNALAAPVFDADGKMQLALTIVGRATTLDVSPGGRPIRVLKARALAITEANEEGRRRSAAS